MEVGRVLERGLRAGISHLKAGLEIEVAQTKHVQTL